MNAYIFELSWYNNVDEAEIKARGIVPAYSYEDAMQVLSKYYGEDEINNIHLEYFADNVVIEVPEYMNLEDIKRMNEF